MKDITIAAAQLACKRGDVKNNLEKHYKLIETAANNGVDLIVFPELSITGYEPDLAEQLAFSRDDERLAVLRDFSVKKNMIIAAGAPVKLDTGLHIGALIFFPDNTIQIYTKRYLHPGEERYFVPGKLNPIIFMGNETILFAICADISNPLHPEDAYKAGCTLYLSGVLVPNTALDKDTYLLREYAAKYSMTVMMANHGGDTGGYKAGGSSLILSNTAKVIAQFDGLGEGLVIAQKVDGKWTGKNIKINYI